MLRRSILLVALLAGSSLAAPPPASTPTGALDFTLTPKGDGFLLADGAYEARFPQSPNVTGDAQKTPSGAVLHSMLALSEDKASGAGYGMVVLPVPATVDYDPKAGLDGARDGALSNSGATLVSETPTTIGGVLKGRHIVGTRTQGGQTLRLDMYLAWDTAHRAMVMVFAGGPAKEPTPTEQAFFASFVVHPKGKAPPPGDGT